MRFATLGGLASACLGLLVVPAASGAQASGPLLPLLVPYGAHGAPGPRTPHRSRNATVTPGGCSSDTNPYFIGISAQNFAGSLSGVLGGATNEACSTSDAIAGGTYNIIGAAGDGGAAQYSFIGSGLFNAITGANDFVGAGSRNGVSGNSSFIGAGASNTGSGNNSFVGAGETITVSGGYSFVGAGQRNVESGDSSFVGAGLNNTESADNSFMGAGVNNTASTDVSFVGAGAGNTASALGSFIGAGIFNNAKGNGSFIGAGDYVYYSTCPYSTCEKGGNTVAGVDSFIGAGDQNGVSANEAFVGGGSHNAIAGSAGWGTIAGGHENAVTGAYATIPGGANNTAAGVLSLAAGYHADATRTGSFVWSDYVSGSSVVQDTAPDQFVVRASGGTYVYSSENLRAGVKLAAGSGTWASLSDRNAKTDVASLDDAAVLAKVATLPVSTWRYKTEAGVRHVGPMAQDFYGAFRVGEDDRHITSIDEDGVALAAIKALHNENARLRDRLAALEKKVEALSAR